MKLRDLAQEELSLNQPKLRAADLRVLAGLTYRQLNDWERRGVLPHERSDQSKWRRLSAWQAMGLTIIAELHSRFGIPLSKQQNVLAWMMGERPTTHDYHDLVVAVNLLLADSKHAGLRDEATQLIVSRWLESLSRKHGTSQQLAELGQERAGSEVSSPSEGSLSRLRQRLVQAVLPSLREAGWDARKGEEFAREFMSICFSGKGGTESFSRCMVLLEMALAADDGLSIVAVRYLGSAVLPIYGAFGQMTTGFPVYLLTDLSEAMFVSEESLLRRVREGSLPAPVLILPVCEHVNAVLKAAGKSPLPVTVRAGDVEPMVQADPQESEREILSLLESSALDRVVIKVADAPYKVVARDDLSLNEKKRIQERLKQGDYQSIAVKREDGTVVRRDN